MKRYLFVCRHNVERSKFGEKFLKGYLAEKNLKGEVFSRGIHWISSIFGRRLKAVDLNGVSRIFVMENYMKDYIFEKFGFSKKKIVVMNIPDDYGLIKKNSFNDLGKIFERFDWNKYL